MDYALIENGVVTNIIVLRSENAEEFSNAVMVGLCPVAIGDTYKDEKFYRNGEEVLCAEEKSAILRSALEELGVEVEAKA